MRRVLLFVLPLLLIGCSKGLDSGNCPLFLSFAEDFALQWADLQTKGGGSLELPDTNDFILVISELDGGKELFRDQYRNKPPHIALQEGSYMLSVYSCDFESPGFDTPQFGDEQQVSLTSEGLSVRFECTQLNSGLRCTFDESFRTQFASSEIVLVQGEEDLKYPYDETRIAYFDCGKISIVLSTGESRRQLLSRTLEANEILTVNFSVHLSSSAEADYHIAVDTGRVWIKEEYIYGKERDGSVKSRALMVDDLPDMIGSEGVWVCGYIVGGDLSSTSAVYKPPFESQTHILISDRPSVASRDGCASVELKSGSIRGDLNLVEHPELLGQKVYLKGNIVESYFGLVGIKSLSEYSFN